jgi:chitinase
MKIFRLLSLLLVVLLASCLNKKKSADTGMPGNESRYVVLAYVTSWGISTPETSCLTHINYAFGHVADDNEPRLQMIVGLKKEKPSLKVLLSVGGWGSSRFSEMAANDSTRTAFAADCRRVIDKFGLDGIDIDWEYPGSGTAGISFSSADKENFTLLMRDVRQAVGKDKLLTIATAATGRYYDFRAIEPYVDYVNIMAYDMEEAPFHHAALHCSDMTEEWSCEKAVAGHIAGGFPVQRLVLGIPFYGHGTNEAPESLDYRHIISIDSLYSRWDSVAQVPYLVNSKGTVVVNYENAQSIELKCRFLHRQGMLGAMYWDYDSDDEMGTLRHAVYRGVMQLP